MADAPRDPGTPHIPGNMADALAAIDAAAGGMFTVDRQLVMRWVSPGFEHLTGVPAAEAVGRACRTVLRGSKCESECPLRWALDHAEIVERCSEVVLRHDDSAFPVCITTTLLHDANGQVEGLIGVLRDETGEHPRPGEAESAAAPADQLRRVLEAHRWNASRAAIALGVSRTTLWRRMKEHGLIRR